jgi:hypothetical protein
MSDRSLASSKAAHELSLAEAAELIEYGASCDRCHETRRIDLHALVQRLGPDYPSNDIRRRLRCSKCGKRGVIIVTLWKSSGSTRA